MHITKETLLSVISQAGITAQQAEKLWDALSKKSETESKFDLPHVLYYLGAMIILSAMGWFMGTGWDRFGGAGLMTISLLYAALFVSLGSFFWNKDNLKAAGGIFITLAVSMTPLALFGFETMTGWWALDAPGSYTSFFSYIKGSWFFMEVGTCLAGAIALYFYRFPFLTAPIAFSLWFMSMDLAPLLLGAQYSYNAALWVSLWFGAVLLSISYLIDQRTRQDFAFWGYLFGLIAFWGSLSAMDSASEWTRLLYCLINLGLILASILLQRKAFIIFGSLGVFGYIGSLSYRLFHDSAAFPFVLSFIGLAIIAVGIAYRKNQTRIEASLFQLLPESCKKLLPRNRN